MKTYQKVARTLQSIANCEREPVNREWVVKHRQTLEAMDNDLPSGAGFDAGSTLDTYASTPEKLVYRTSFHHMNESGMYDGWTEHEVIVTPSLSFGFNLRISGRNRNGIKEYIAEQFQEYLDSETDY